MPRREADDRRVRDAHLGRGESGGTQGGGGGPQDAESLKKEVEVSSPSYLSDSWREVYAHNGHDYGSLMIMIMIMHIVLM